LRSRESKANKKAKEKSDLTLPSSGQSSTSADRNSEAPPEPQTDEATETVEAVQEAFKRSHRGVKRNWQLPADFPSETVRQAYLDPKVDSNKTKFSFGLPDVSALETFCSEKFGWSSHKTRQILDPVVVQIQNRQRQMRITDFLGFCDRFAKIKSKRMQAAVAGLSKDKSKLSEIMLRDSEARRF